MDEFLASVGVMNLGEMLRLAREGLGWSREELSNKTRPRVAESTIRRLEENEDSNPRLDTIEILADALGPAFRRIALAKLLADETIPMHRTAPLDNQRAFRVSSHIAGRIPRYPIIDDPEEYALKVTAPLNIEFIHEGWVLYLSPNAPIQDGDLVLVRGPGESFHLERYSFERALDVASPAMRDRLQALRQEKQPQKVVMISTV